MMKTRSSMVVWVGALVLAGCSKVERSEPKQPPQALPDEAVFTITATNEVVAEAQLPRVAPSRIVRADFNMDQLEDIAIAEQNEQGQGVISVYLRKHSDDRKKMYFRAGGIQREGDFDISAIMSRKGSNYTDLVVMFNYADGVKEMAHFRSDGKAFREIMRKPVEEETP